MKRFIVVLTLSASFAHGACLTRGSTALNVLSMDFAGNNEIIINNPSLPYGCGTDDCAILRDDLFTFNKSTNELTWKRQPRPTQKIQTVTIKMKRITSTTVSNTKVNYLGSSDMAGVDGFDYYLLYTGSKNCVMIDQRYEKTPDTDNCRTYSFEVFPVNSSTSPPLDFVRPDNATAVWYRPGCSEDADPPAVGGGSEPPPKDP